MKQTITKLVAVGLILAVMLVVSIQSEMGSYTLEQEVAQLNRLLEDKDSVINDLTEMQKKHEEALPYGVCKITYYCACKICCGKETGITASGKKVKEGVTCAAPSTVPFGTRLFIEGLGWRTVHDRGGAVQGNVIDVYVASHEEALKRGVDYAYVIKEHS